MAADKEEKVIIPRQHDPNNGNLPAFQEDFDPEKHKREDATKRQWDHTIDQVDEVGADGEGTTATKGGQIKQTHAAPGAIEASQKKKDQERQRLLKTIRQIQKQHEELMRSILDEMASLEMQNIQLQHEIDENTSKIETLLEENDALKALQERLRGGESPESVKEDDAYQNAAKNYREQTGKDPDALNPFDLLLWQRTRNQAKIAGLNAENAAKAHQIAENKIRYEELKELKAELEEMELETQEIEDPVERAQVLQEVEDKLKSIRSQLNDIVSYKNMGLRKERRELQESHAGVEDRGKYDDHRQRDGHILNTEAEIESFMKDYAQAQDIDHVADRLTREQELLGSLSPEAQDQLSMSEETEHLFEDQYFAALDNKTDVPNEQVLVKSGPSLG